MLYFIKCSQNKCNNQSTSTLIKFLFGEIMFVPINIHNQYVDYDGKPADKARATFTTLQETTTWLNKMDLKYTNEDSLILDQYPEHIFQWYQNYNIILHHMRVNHTIQWRHTRIGWSYLYGSCWQLNSRLVDPVL